MGQSAPQTGAALLTFPRRGIGRGHAVAPDPAPAATISFAALFYDHERQ